MENERQKRFMTAFNYLRQEGIIQSQKDLVEKMDSNKATVSSALNGREGYLTDSFIYKFNAAVGDIFSLRWLLNGEGPMMADGTDEVVANMVLCIPLSAAGGSLMDAECDGVVPYEKVVSPVNNVDFAIGVYGDSMEPTYPSGSRVFIKRIDPTSFIAWGCCYVLDTVNGIYIKEVQKGSDDQHLTCISHNRSGRYPEFEIPMCDIHGMYRVVACISVTQ